MDGDDEREGDAGHHPLGCIFGGFTQYSAYWMVADGCTLDHTNPYVRIYVCDGCLKEWTVPVERVEDVLLCLTCGARMSMADPQPDA